MEIILEFDKDLLIFLNSTGSHMFDQFWLIVTNKYTHIPLYFFLLYLAFKKLKKRQNLNKKKLIKIYLFFIFSVIFLIFISDQLSNLFKYSFQRLRPCHDEQIQSLIIDAANELNYSFKKMPSGAGHDAQDMAVIVPSGMIFIPSVDGISHSPKEFSSEEAVYKGTNILLQTILKIDKERF